MATRLRVAMGTDYPMDPDRVRGGVEAAALFLAQALSRRGDVDLHVVSCRPEVRERQTERRGGLTVHWVPTGRRLHNLRVVTVDFRRVRRAYEEIEPDVVHAQDYSEYALAALPHLPMILTVHGFEMFVRSTLEQSRYRGAVGLYRRTMERWIANESVQRAVAIVSIAGDYVPRQIGDRLIGSRKVYEIANALPDKFWSITEGPREDRQEVLCVGDIMERKNMLGLLRAFARIADEFPGASLRFAGGTSEPAYLHRLNAEVTSLGLENRVHLLGRLNQGQLLDEYSRCCIVALASVQETAPISLAQGMAAARPVVATRAGGIPWMVEDGVAGFLVDPGDESEMARRLAKLLRSPEKRLEMGASARASSMRLFHGDAVAEKTVQAYSDLLGTAVKRRAAAI